jgi:outer membrane lipoprotein-sorting protein
MRIFSVIALCLGILACAPRPARAQIHGIVLSDSDQAEITRIETYLDQLTTLKARFLQIAEDGQTVQGSAWLSRPGKMRFEYDKPSPLLLVAGHGIAVFHDASLDQTSNIPLNSTPLGVLLGEHIKLHGDVTVTDFTRPPGQYALTIVRTASPSDGTLTLMLNQSPLMLSGWSIVDAEGHETRIRLANIQLGGDFPDSLFTFIDPHFFDQGNGN